MAPTSERISPSSPFVSQPVGDLLLRVMGGEHHGRTVRLQAAKCTVGSAPGCTLRLRAAGIEPLHCLILRGPNGTIVRRVGEELELNGRRIEDAPLRTGDRLKLGPITFIVGGEQAVADETPRPQRRIVSASQQREADRHALREARQLGHQRMRKAVAALRRNREDVRELAYAADRRKLELDRLVVQMSQVQRDLTTERERHLHDLDQQRALGLQVSQQSHSLERTRQEMLATQTKHQTETDHWRLERSRLTDDLASREHQLHQLQAEIQRRQWDLDQLQSQNDRLQRQLELEHEQATTARARFQQEHATSQLERTRDQEELLSKDRQLAQTEVELQLRQRETVQLRDLVERLQKQLQEEQLLLKAELERRNAANDTQERDRLAADVVARDRQIGDLQVQLASQQATVTQLREDLARQREELKDFRSEACRATQTWEIERLQIIGKVSEAAAHDATVLSEQQQTVNELEARMRGLEAELRDREREIEAQRTELQQLRNDRDRRLDETRDWQERLIATEKEVEELRKTNSDLSIRLSTSEPIEQTLVVPMLAGGSSGRLSKEQQEVLEQQRTELAERERELTERHATLEERQRALQAAECELSQERQTMLGKQAELQAEHDRLSAAARNLVDQEKALVISQEELADKEQQLLQLQQQLESHVAGVEQRQMEAVSLPPDSAVAEPEPEPEPETPLGMAAVDFSQAEAELEKLCGDLVANITPLDSSPYDAEPAEDKYNDGIMLPTAESPFEGIDRRFRRPQEVAVEIPPPPVENHAALADAVLADGMKTAPDVTPDSLPQWSYEHETPQRMDTIVGLRMQNLLHEAAEFKNSPDYDSEDIQPPTELNPPPSTSESSVDDILSRLREAGILKQSEGSSFPAGFAEPAHTENSETYQRYAEEPAVVDAEPIAEETPIHASPEPAPAAAEHTGGEGDESIEAYMQQLMRRVRGDQAPSVSTSGPNPMYRAAAAPLTNAELAPAALAAGVPQPVAPVTPEEYIPRSQAPEMSSSMAAMRELANSQARSAIHVHQKKLGKQQSGGKILVAFCAIGFGGFAAYLGLQNGSYPALAAAALSVGLGSYWLLQALWLAGRSLAKLPQRMILERPKTQDKQPPTA